MAMATTYAPLPEAEQSAQLRKAVIASTVGTTIEWYDFFLYGTAAGQENVSDRRRPPGLFGFLYFAMVGHGNSIDGVHRHRPLAHSPRHAVRPQGAFIAEAFTPRLRYSGSSLGYQFASIIAGGPAPIIATALFAAYQTSFAVAIYIAACAIVGFVAAAFMPDYTGKDISAEYDD